MTTATDTHTPSGSSATARHDQPSSVLHRVVSVARLHLVNRNGVLWLPLFIMSVIWVSSMLIWWIVAINLNRAGMEAGNDGVIVMGGASSFLVIYMLVVAVQAVNLTFPFAQGYSVTRRDFYLGSALAFVGLSLFYSVLMTALGVLEEATSGWGLGGYMFGLGQFGVTGLSRTFYLYFMALLFFFFLGMAVAAMYVRWHAWGITGFFAGLGFLIIGLIALATFTESWPQVWAWIFENGAIGIATWSIVPTVIAAVAGFLILRRATPRE
ncbi:MAG TPA: ABC transporter permease [Terrimesophilobacter sp.]|nr:ABC transporter permease [Terrimesophilobacter sp.]HRQ00286.1 ABC transporter permease [Terrimesophilobacter sp.]